MYKIIASDSNPRCGAILQKENGEFCFSSLMLPVREEWLQGFREGEIKVFIERDKLVPHTPPTQVEKLEDWPEVAAKYEKEWREKQQARETYAVAP